MRRAIVGAVVLGLVGLSACGSGSHNGSPGGTTANVLTAAYRATQTAKTAKVVLSVAVGTAGSSQPLTVVGKGAFAWIPLAGAMTMTLSLPGRDVAVPTRMIGTTIYEQLPGASSALGGKSWIGLDLSGLVNGSSLTSTDPTEVLSLLEGSAQSITKVGTETVAGVRTTHYHAVVDVAAMGSDLSSTGKALLQSLAQSGVSTVPIDVWIDAAGRPAQVKFTMTVPRPPAGTAAPAGAFPETVGTIEGFSDWGVAVHVTAPPSSQVYSMTWQQLQHLEGA